MATVLFFDEIENRPIRYVVIAAQEKGRWIWVRHRLRKTWEMPGGHVESGETPIQAARRELWEETGSTQAAFRQVCVYFASGREICKDGLTQSYGVLFLAEVTARGPLPPSEIGKVFLRDSLPPSEQQTYPWLHPQLWHRALAFQQINRKR